MDYYCKFLLFLLTFSPYVLSNDTSTSFLQFNKQVVHDGFEGANLRFQVTKSDTASNSTFICLQAEFKMNLVVQEHNADGNKTEKLSINMGVDTVLNETLSTCTSLFLQFNGDADSSVKLLFNKGTSQKAETGVEYWFLNELRVENIEFVNKENDTSQFSSSLFYKEQQSKPDNNNPNKTKSYSPMEWDTTNSFKCYTGFHSTNPTEEKESAIFQISISQIRTQMMSQPDVDPNINQGKRWMRTFSCDSDISKTLPIIVGVILGLVVVITLISYFLARRRSRFAYEEI